MWKTKSPGAGSGLHRRDLKMRDMVLFRIECLSDSIREVLQVILGHGILG